MIKEFNPLAVVNGAWFFDMKTKTTFQVQCNCPSSERTRTNQFVRNNPKRFRRATIHEIRATVNNAVGKTATLNLTI